MTSGKQTVHTVTTIYWGEKFYGQPKRVSIQVITLLIKLNSNQ